MDFYHQVRYRLEPKLKWERIDSPRIRFQLEGSKVEGWGVYVFKYFSSETWEAQIWFKSCLVARETKDIELWAKNWAENKLNEIINELMDFKKVEQVPVVDANPTTESETVDAEK